MVEVRAWSSLAVAAVAAACSVSNPLFDLPDADGSGSGSGAASTGDDPSSSTDMSSGTGNPSTTTTAATGSTTDPGPVCGNGDHEAGEQCDDGNNTPGDDCESNCAPLFRPDDLMKIDIAVTGAVAVAVADFDGDGLSDVALSLAANSCGQGSCVRTWRNGGEDQPFTEITVFPPLAVSLPRLVVGDWNADGKPDLAGADGSGVLALLNGAPQAIPATFPGKPDTLITADLDGDGDRDLVMASPDGKAIGTMLVDPTLPMFFDPPIMVPVGPLVERVAVADVDKNGEPDFVYSVYEGADAGFVVRLGMGADAQQLQFDSLSGHARALAVGEYGGQSGPNVVLSDPNEMLGKHIQQFFANEGMGSFSLKLTAEAEPDTRLIELIQFGNGQGNNIVALAPSGIQIFTYANDQIVAGPTRALSGTHLDLAAGQLGGDPRTDLAVLTTAGCYALINRSSGK